MYEDVKSLKELLDSGLITQQEYDKKKSEILGIETAEDREIREEIESAWAEQVRRGNAAKAEKGTKAKVKAKRWGKAVALVALAVALVFVAISLDAFIAKTDREKATKQVQPFMEDMAPYLAYLGKHTPDLNISMSQELIDGSYAIRFGSIEGTVSHMTTDASKQILDLCTWESNNSVSSESYSEMITCLDDYFNSESIEQQVAIEGVGGVDATIWKDPKNASVVCIWQDEGKVSIRWAYDRSSIISG